MIGNLEKVVKGQVTFRLQSLDIPFRFRYGSYMEAGIGEIGFPGSGMYSATGGRLEIGPKNGLDRITIFA